jgi:small subunit ribosomal protein S21
MLKVKVQKGNIERALKQYKSKVIKTRQMRELNNRKEYEKPSETRRKEINKAKYVNKKNQEK